MNWFCKYLKLVLALAFLVLALAGCRDPKGVSPGPISNFRLVQNPGSYIATDSTFEDICGEMEIFDDTRRGFFMGKVKEISFSVTGPSSGSLKFSYGLSRNASHYSGEITVKVIAVSPAGDVPVGSWVIDPRGEAVTRQWFEAQAIWPDTAKGDVILKFTASGLFDDAPPDTLVIANPVIVSGDNAQKKKNVIIIAVSAFRTGDLGCYGYARQTSPNIDAFAEDSLRYERCFTTSSWTFPSAVSLLTGKSPGVPGLIDEGNILADNSGLLPDTLSSAGMATLLMFEDSSIGPKSGIAKGFDEARRFRFAHAGEIWGEAGEWMNSHADEGFLAVIHIADLGLPYVPPLEFRGRFDPEYNGPYKYFYTEEGFSWGGEIDLPDDVREHIHALYDEEVVGFDAKFHGFIEELKSFGLYDSSLIILTGLHGEELFEHGGMGHGHQLYGEIVRVPLIVHEPQGNPGVDHALTSIVDIYPTILTWLSMPAPPDIPGTLLSNGDPNKSERSLWAGVMLHGERQVAITEGDYHFIYDVEKGTGELYNYIDDPGMLKNIAEEHPDIVAHALDSMGSMFTN